MNRANCCKLVIDCAAIKELQKLHGQAVACGLHPHLQPLSCQILNSYARFGDFAAAHKVFDEIPHPDLVTLTSRMTLYLQTNQPHQALSLFSQLTCSSCRLDGFAVVGALSASARIGDLVVSKSLHGMVYRHGLSYETAVSNSLIDMYYRHREVGSSQGVFNQMVVRDEITWSSMLHGYIKCMGVDCALKLFEEMPQRDTVSWTVLITGHVQEKQPVRALELYRLMKLEDHRPTLVTVVGVLSACADIGALDLGRAIHGYVVKANVGSDLTVSNALMDMYAKSGSVEMASVVFKENPVKDVFTWTTMISGFTAHGNGERAMEVFLQMLSSGISPNAVTFVSVLSACSHAGLIQEGRKWFDIMRSVYDFEPKLEHYGCMVDLLGRAGLLSEAKSFIGSMEIEPDAVIWRSILSACLVHGDEKLAETAAREIIKREPEDDGVYILLWNMCASSNRWDEALELRKKMRNRKIFKKPGQSWIELDGVVHEFLVEDKMHSLRREIYEVLEFMTNQLKIDADLCFLDGNVCVTGLS